MEQAMKKDKQNRRLAIYIDEPTLVHLQTRYQEMHRQGLSVSMSQIVSHAIRQGLKQEVRV
jgi:hypothetical protein